MSATHELELRVRYAESDQMGVVYHANYLVWCEMGRTELIRALTGVSYAQLEEQGVALAVAELSIRYHGAARYDNLIRVRTTLTEARSRSVTAREAADRGVRTGGAERNLAFLESLVDWGRATETDRVLMIDPQTSGGLLVALSEDRVAQYLSRVPGAVEIGVVISAGPTGLVLA